MSEPVKDLDSVTFDLTEELNQAERNAGLQEAIIEVQKKIESIKEWIDVMDCAGYYTVNDALRQQVRIDELNEVIFMITNLQNKDI